MSVSRGRRTCTNQRSSDHEESHGCIASRPALNPCNIPTVIRAGASAAGEGLILVGCDFYMPAMAISEANSYGVPKCRKQKLFVMRHGQRWDDANREWVHEVGARTWDPPLTENGLEQARSAGETMRSEGVLISRIFVSPFLRCVQTAAGFIKGMYPEGSDISKLKVSDPFSASTISSPKQTPPVHH